jgi:poly-gamma-glutamate synthesis protein (capsule biosynthesis protein)
MDDEFNKGMNQIDMAPPQPHIAKPRRSRKKLIITVVVMLLICTAAVVAYMLLFKKSADAPAETNQSTSTVEEAPEKARVRLIATGDMIPHDAINAEAKQADGTYEYSKMFGDMKKYFDAADVRFCNQAVLGGGTEFGITGYPKFNSPTEFARDMAELGCNVVNTGSNHTNDFPQKVIDASVSAWDGLPGMLAIAGANTSATDKQKIRYFESKGVKFAFVSYTTYSNEPGPTDYSVTMYSPSLAKQQLAEARSKADIVLVSMRWGTEYSPNINAQQKAQAKQVANFGADVILGHGPHVLEPAEKITLDDGRNAYVWYSLGNFLNAQLDPPSLFNGIAVMDIDPKTKKIASPTYLPVYMHYEWSEADKAAGKLLTRKNFSMFTFDDAAAPLKKSVNNTTLEAQKQRITNTLNTLMTIKLLSKDEYLQS